MKRLFYIPLLFILLFGCKKDKIDMQPDEIIEPLVGKWLLTESEQSVNGKKVWQPVNSNDPQYLVFRFDGVCLTKTALRIVVLRKNCRSMAILLQFNLKEK